MQKLAMNLNNSAVLNFPGHGSGWMQMGKKRRNSRQSSFGLSN
jgi:hypothetical protein